MKRAAGDNGEPDCAIIGGILLWTLGMPYILGVSLFCGFGSRN